MAGMARKAKRGRLTLPRWAWLAVALAFPLVALNFAVSFCGRTVVFPLSPFFLREKMQAMAAYARHRLDCVAVGHEPLDGLLDRIERRHNLPRHLLTAVVTVESGKQVHRISPTGAMGPGQLMPGTARDLNVKDPFDPEANLDGSARYIAWLLRRYRRLPLAVAAYNAGPGNVKDRVPRNGETEHYVRKVLDVRAALTRQPRSPRVALR